MHNAIAVLLAILLRAYAVLNACLLDATVVLITRPVAVLLAAYVSKLIAFVISARTVKLDLATVNVHVAQDVTKLNQPVFVENAISVMLKFMNVPLLVENVATKSHYSSCVQTADPVIRSLVNV